MLRTDLQKYIFLFSFAVLLLLSPTLGAAPSQNPESNEDRLVMSKIETRLATVEKRINSIQENQTKLNKQQAEIKSELDILGVWIRRR